MRIPRLRRAPAKPSEWQRLFDRRLASVVRVDQPLVLVSQVQRSGGTLLSQLFDGHPQVHAHPYELKIGHPKTTWPRIDLAAGPEAWWLTLYEFDTRRLFAEGYRKYSAGGDAEAFPFLLPFQFQKRLFLRLAEDWPVRSERDAIDCYLTSYFNAWLDNQNLYSVPKRIVTGFTPGLIAGEGNVAAFLDTYPDGKLVSLVREPKAWLASASRHHPEGYADVDAALEVWRRSTQAALDARAEHGSCVIVLPYEQLVRATEETMRTLAAGIGIDFLPCLLEPTFNGMPIRADSAFAIAEHGVITAPLERGRELDASLAARVDAELGALYASASR